MVVDEVATRRLPELNLEWQAKACEKLGTGIVKRLALVQADIWATRDQAGEICEFPHQHVAEDKVQTHLTSLLDEIGACAGEAQGWSDVPWLR